MERQHRLLPVTAGLLLALASCLTQTERPAGTMPDFDLIKVGIFPQGLHVTGSSPYPYSSLWHQESEGLQNPAPPIQQPDKEQWRQAFEDPAA